MRRNDNKIFALGVIALFVTLALSVANIGLVGVSLHSLITGNFPLMWKYLGFLAGSVILEFCSVVMVGAAFSK